MIDSWAPLLIGLTDVWVGTESHPKSGSKFRPIFFLGESQSERRENGKDGQAERNTNGDGRRVVFQNPARRENSGHLSCVTQNILTRGKLGAEAGSGWRLAHTTGERFNRQPTDLAPKHVFILFRHCIYPNKQCSCQWTRRDLADKDTLKMVWIHFTLIDCKDLGSLSAGSSFSTFFHASLAASSW